MIRCFHEAPKCLFYTVQNITSGDYALVHLFEQDYEYYNLFKDAVSKGREVILDNSVFELGEAFNEDKFVGWIRELKPAYYVVPDVLENGYATIDSFKNFTSKYPDLPGKKIGVIQGKDIAEFIECYKVLEPHCDMVGISFDYSWYQSMVDNGSPLERMCWGRQKLLYELDRLGVINRYKQHHLLGVALPQEVKLYGCLQNLGYLEWIYSIDTSNPVVHGMGNIAYNSNGLRTKCSQKLCTMIDEYVSIESEATVVHNINRFRRWANGEE